MTPGAVASVLADVFDPELGIDIVALGLVYGINCSDGHIAIQMTTTSQDCPMSAALVEMAEATLRARFPGDTVHVALVGSPPWDVSMADRASLAALGLAPRR